MIQVFAHLPRQEGRVAALALWTDEDARWRAAKRLEVEVTRGTKIGFHLNMPRAVVDEPDQHVVWQGDREDAPPAIIPVPLEGPPPVKPPPELDFPHFNDKYIYLMKGVEAEAEARRKERT